MRWLLVIIVRAVQKPRTVSLNITWLSWLSWLCNDNNHHDISSPSLDMKGCICHLIEWQIHPFILFRGLHVLYSMYLLFALPYAGGSRSPGYARLPTCTDQQSRTAVTAYLTSEQLLLFACAWQCRSIKANSSNNSLEKVTVTAVFCPCMQSDTVSNPVYMFKADDEFYTFLITFCTSPYVGDVFCTTACHDIVPCSEFTPRSRHSVTSSSRPLSGRTFIIVGPPLHKIGCSASDRHRDRRSSGLELSWYIY